MNDKKRYFFYIESNENLENHRSTIFTIFSKHAKVTKLYLSESENKVYFATLEEAKKVYAAVSKCMPLDNLIHRAIWPDRFDNKFSPRGRIQSEPNDEVNSSEISSEDMNSNSSYCEPKNYVDLFGNPIPVLEGEDCELYVPLKEVLNRGLKIISKEEYPSKIVTRSELIQQFEVYMQGKAVEFLQKHQCKDDIDDGVIKQIVNRTKSLSFKRKDDSPGEKIPPQKPLNAAKKITSPVAKTTNFNSVKLNVGEIHEVNVTLIKNESVVFVNLANDTVEKFLIEVNNCAEKSPPVTQNTLKEGTVYAGFYEDLWYRVLLLHKNELLFEYVDYGNRAKCKLSELRELPKELASRPYQAINILAADSTKNLTENETYFMKPIKETQYGYIGIFKKDKKDFDNMKPIPKKKLPFNSSNSTSSGTESSDEVTRLPPLRSSSKRTHREISPIRETTTAQKPPVPEITPVSERNISKPIRKTVAQFNTCMKSPTETSEDKTKKNMAHIRESLFKNAAKENTHDKSSNTWGERTTARIKPMEKNVYMNKRSCVIEKVGITCIIVPTVFIDEHSFFAYIISNDKEQEPINQLYIDIGREEPLSDANVGDMVVVQHDDGDDEFWARALITEIRPTGLKYHVALIDCGQTSIVNEVYACPDDIIDNCEFSFICTTTDKVLAKKLRDAKDGDSIMCAIQKPGQCIITMNNNTYTLDLKRWNPFSKDTKKTPLANSSPVKPQKVYKCIPPSYTLANNDTLRIIKERDGFLYVQTKACHDTLREINTEILKLKGEDLIVNKPEVNQMVLVPKSHDENLHRALIMKITGNEATVNLIDYAEIATVPLNVIKNVNEKLSKMYCGIIKTPKLVHYTKKQFTPKSLGYIQECINKKKKFNARLCENDTINLVSIDDGVSLDGKLTELDQPLIMYDKASFYCPTQGCATLMCLNTDHLRKGLLVFCFADNYATSILGQISTLIEKYIDKKNVPYEPSVREICLAEFEDEWYRAVVTEKSNDGYTVAYLDYGNSSIVLPSQIKKLPQELIAQPCIALYCLLSLEGLKLTPKGIPEPQFKQLNELLKEEQLYEVNIKATTDADNFLIKYVVEIPSISKQLEYEYDGLL